MEKIEYRYRFQAHRTCLLLVDDSDGSYIADGLYDGPISDLGVKLPVKWEEGRDDTASQLFIKLPEHFRIVIWPADESEEKDEVNQCLVKSIDEIQAWADIEIGMYQGFDSFWTDDLLKKVLKKPEHD